MYDAKQKPVATNESSDVQKKRHLRIFQNKGMPV